MIKKSFLPKHITVAEIQNEIINGNIQFENLFYLKYHDELLKYCIMKCEDNEKAKDLMQDCIITTLLRVRNKKVVFNDEDHVLNSMKQTIKYLLKNLERKNKHFVRDKEIMDSIINIEDSPAFNEKLYHAISVAMEMISAKCRDLLSQIYLNGRKLAEVINRHHKFDNVRQLSVFKYKCTIKLKKIALTLIKE